MCKVPEGTSEVLWSPSSLINRKILCLALLIFLVSVLRLLSVHSLAACFFVSFWTCFKNCLKYLLLRNHLASDFTVFVNVLGLPCCFSFLLLKFAHVPKSVSSSWGLLDFNCSRRWSYMEAKDCSPILRSWLLPALVVLCLAISLPWTLCAWRLEMGWGSIWETPLLCLLWVLYTSHWKLLLP